MMHPCHGWDSSSILDSVVWIDEIPFFFEAGVSRRKRINKPVAATVSRVVVLRRLPNIPVPHLVLTELSQESSKNEKDASGMCV